VAGVALAVALVRARDVAVFARVLADVLPDRAVGGFFARVLAVPVREVAGVAFGRAPGPDPGLVPAAGSPAAVVP